MSARREASRDRDEAAGSLQLFDVFERPDDPVVAVAGLDARAPRSLVLYQIDEASRRATPVARVESGDDGVFAVERLLLSVRGVRLVVAPAGSDPFGPEASAPVDFAARVPEALPDSIAREAPEVPDGGRSASRRLAEAPPIASDLLEERP